MEHHARLELARVVSQIGEERLRVHELVPVHGAEKQRHGGLELADHLAEVVATVPVQDHERSEEHTSELQSQSNLVCRLLLEKKKTPQDRPVWPCLPDNSTRPSH